MSEIRVAALMLAEALKRSPSPPRMSKGSRWDVTEIILRSMSEALTESRLVDDISIASSESRVVSLAEDMGVPGIPIPPGEISTDTLAGFKVDKGRGSTNVMVARGLLPLLQAQEVAFLLGRSSRDSRLVIAPSPNTIYHGIAVGGPSSTVNGLVATLVLRSDARLEAEETPMDVHWLDGTFAARNDADLVHVFHSSRPSPTKQLLRDMSFTFDEKRRGRRK